MDKWVKVTDGVLVNINSCESLTHRTIIHSNRAVIDLLTLSGKSYTADYDENKQVFDKFYNTVNNGNRETKNLY